MMALAFRSKKGVKKSMKKVLVAVDGSGNSLRALEFALEMKKMCADLQITALYVGPSLSGLFPEAGMSTLLRQKDLDKEIEERAQKISEKVDEVAAPYGFEVEKAIARGDAGAAICKLAEEQNYDLVVVGTRGYGEIKNILVGSVSHKVIHLCPCPVVVVK
jgi:nucleotide-binding universal stress UspA family protein